MVEMLRGWIWASMNHRGVFSSYFLRTSGLSGSKDLALRHFSSSKVLALDLRIFNKRRHIQSWFLICESLTEDGTHRLLICKSLTEDGTRGSWLLICESLTEDGTYG
ncbi:hypothetical protein GLOIN_2v1477333 [Rhizophagus irregularis DAOM 181602=DAOM 197198]|uniref:Uncharacterized protein n=1 Tax=Rhizophagus irregularis (strain DAOM 181602 / DAOM 197198 / MUCL 43194) TaxID=747089 RepID=A0A2P4Q5I1_RHIID|nr:hypothetical protein GLOIN_2v1477333 [Rhizophagus irregularis DAOM 181602=DAOM 197198]POG72852.1 hypothetical protein GLOIN_2v1477333 [Rhizophagus irregularis DAOM 181602=DAOM 197198]|eukprot:XP_025179718.1 hypothetical protein GLOIN_2v1477333 [Rhizophagus irregularis DAOM 181602=DAOM 197198]